MNGLSINLAQIENYLEKCWVCTHSLPDADTELSVWSFESHDSPALMTLELGVHSVDTDGTQMLSLYCPFWMLNKTGFTLCYRVSCFYLNKIKCFIFGFFSDFFVFFFGSYYECSKVIMVVGRLKLKESFVIMN